MDNENLMEVLEELQKDTLNTEEIQDNKLFFMFDDNSYRVRMPNQKENAIANNYKNKIYIQLLQEKNDDGNPAHMMLKNLIILLKETNQADIAQFDKLAKELENELTQLYLTLAKKKTSEKKVIKKIKTEMAVVRNKRLAIIIEKAGYLSPAIEHQTQDDYYRCMTAICTEKLVDEEKDKWTKVWSKFSQFEKDSTKLPYLSLGKFTELMFGV